MKTDCVTETNERTAERRNEYTRHARSTWAYTMNRYVESK